MNFDNKKIMPRFFVVIVLMSLGGLYILGNAAYLMFVESEYWTQVSRKLVKENVPIPAKRGNILSADGQIMASSLPEYKIYMESGNGQGTTGLERQCVDSRSGFHFPGAE